MIEELVVNVISNAPAVLVLFYLVLRLDNRLQELQDVMLQVVIEKRVSRQ
jgi:hypothetical protein